MRTLPKLPGRAAALMRAHGRSRSKPPRSVRRVRSPAMMNVWKHTRPIPLDIAAIFDPFGNAVHTALRFPC